MGIDWIKKMFKSKDYKSELDNLKIENNALKIKLSKLNPASPSPVTPKSLGTIKGYEVMTALKPYCNSTRIFLSDGFYSTTSMVEGRNYTKLSKINLEKYESNKHDCDNFSFALNGYWSESLYSFCFGIAWSKTHAFNIMIDNTNQIWIIEPQSNNWIKISDALKFPQYQNIQLIAI